MSRLAVIGKSIPRVDGREKVTGAARYVADVRLPGMVYGRLVLSPHPHARVRRIRTEAAERLPGVLAVLTGHDLTNTGLLARDEVFHVGHPVAVCVATSEALAEDAAERIEVEYEPLPAVLDPIAAMRPDSPLTRPADAEQLGEDAGVHGAAVGEAAGEEKPRNVNTLVRFKRGDVGRGWTEADVVLEDTYRVARVHQGYLEPQGAVARAEADGTITLWTSTQGHFAARRYTAETLGVPESQLRVNAMTVGGGFGGKFVLLEPLCAELSRRLRRPVKIILDRLQDFLVTNPGPEAIITLRMGARRDGTLTALEARLVFDSGASPGAPAGIAALLLGGTYRVPNLDLVSYEVLTHKTPVGAYRAPGAPQAYFALESHVDRLARRLGLDPVELRLKNAVREGDERPDGKPWPRIGLVECLERLRDHPLWRERRTGEDEGIGIAVGGWPGGTEPAAAACRVNGDGTLTVHVGAVDISGTHTSFALIAAEVMGFDPAKVQVILGDTDHAPYGGAAGGSKTTYTVGVSVLRAAEDLRRQVLEMAADRLEAAVDDLELADGRVQVRGAPQKHVAVAELAQLATGFGSRYPPLHGQGRSAVHQSSPGFAAHLARVRVDRATGAVRVTGYLAVQDVGRALNPAEVAGQVRGGVAQGIGRALLERMVYDDSGQLANASLMEYTMPTGDVVPDIAVELVEVPSPHGPYGAKGVGEPPAVPGPAAVANAVEDAVGVRVTGVPISPEAVLAGLEAAAGGRPPAGGAPAGGGAHARAKEDAR